MDSRLFFCPVLFLCFFCFSASAADIFVGRDNCLDSGQATIGQPLCTIREGLKRLAAGDTLIIREGTYNENDFMPASIASGTEGHPITIKNYPGEHPWIRSSWAGSGWIMGFYFQGSNLNKSYFVFDGLEVSNFKTCFKLEGGNSNFIFRNLVIHDCEAGIKFGANSNNIVVENISSHDISNPYDSDNGHGAIECSGSQNVLISNINSFHDGIYADAIASLCDNVTIRDVNITNSPGDGIDVTGQNVAIDNVRIINSGIVGLKAHYRDNGKPLVLTVSNALIVGSGEDGFKSGGSGPNGRNITITNSTFYGNTENGIQIQAFSGGTSQVTLRNIIVANNNKINGFYGIKEASGNTVTASNILFFDNRGNNHNLASPPSYSIFDLDPLFENAAQNNFHLTTNSPARDSGTSQGAPLFDLDGNPRPSGNAVDIGAFEFQSGVAECVTMENLINHVSQWKQGALSMGSLIQKIGSWKAGTGCG